MIKTKILKAESHTLLESQINNFIRHLKDEDVIDITYQAPTSSLNSFTAMIIYVHKGDDYQ